MAAQEWEQTANFLKTPQQRHEPKANVECSAQERDFPGPASIKRLIHSHLPEMSCKWIKTVDSAVTTAWGVRWNEMQIARDVLQNFFDANRDNLDAVQVTTHERDVRIIAPAVFDLEGLFYLGSEKTTDDIGQYGEGFKAAATCLLRDHGVTPIGVSGTTMVQVRLAPKPIGKTRLQPLVYDFYKISPAYEGSLLLLPACSHTLSRELQRGMAHFFYELNPSLGALQWRSGNQEYALYASKTHDGCIFYRRLKRATIPGIPVVLVIHKASKRIDKKIEQDRDRNAFEDAVLDLCYEVFARESARTEKVVQTVLRASQHLWERGHALLSAVAKHCWGTVDKETIALFGDRYYAACHHRNIAERLEHERIEAQWRAEGRRQLPAYFTEFGVISAETRCNQLREQAIAEAQKKARSLTNGEQQAIKVLHRALTDLAPILATHLRSKHLRYAVADTDVILGALKQGRDYQSMEVFLAASAFTEDLARALAIFLHEHAHVYGYDGSRAFTDALTELIETIIRNREALETYDNDWQAARKGVIKERGLSRTAKEETIPKQLQRLDREALLALLERIPGVILRQLLGGSHARPGHDESQNPQPRIAKPLEGKPS